MDTAQQKYGRLVQVLEQANPDAATTIKGYVTALRGEAAALRVLNRDMTQRVAYLEGRLAERSADRA